MPGKASSNEIRLTRVYDAPVRAVWDAWTIPEQVEKWWGPRGFTLTTHEKDLRVGGTWRYTMHGPDGVDYPNITTYYVVEPYKKLVYDHGATDESPALFRVTVTFTEDHGRTKMEMISTLPTPEAAQQMAKFIKQAGGNATWDRLAEYLGQTMTGKQSFAIHRTLDAPITRVFELWTGPEHLAKWFPPPGTEMRFLRSVIAKGKSALFVLAGERGAAYVRADYLAIEPPRRIVYRQQFVDEHEQAVCAPDAESWPTTLSTTVLFEEEAPDRTRMTVTIEPAADATFKEVETFVNERPRMTLAWTSSFDALDKLLDPDDDAV